MRKKMSQFSKLIVFITLGLFTAIGCVEKTPSVVEPVPQVNPCVIPSGHKVNNAFDIAYATLSNPACSYEFENIFMALLEVCEGDPKNENKELFSNFLEWVKNKGMISELQAKEYYTTYFSPRFVSLPSGYQTCNYCPTQQKIIKACRDEVKKKERGLLKICGDKNLFAKAAEDLQGIELILEATCEACRAE